MALTRHFEQVRGAGLLHRAAATHASVLGARFDALPDWLHAALWPHAWLATQPLSNQSPAPAPFAQAGAASVKMVSFLSKPARRTTPYEPDYLCFDVPDKFVVGMGLDFNEQYRSLPYVGVLKPECYS